MILETRALLEQGDLVMPEGSFERRCFSYRKHSKFWHIKKGSYIEHLSLCLDLSHLLYLEIAQYTVSIKRSKLKLNRTT